MPLHKQMAYSDPNYNKKYKARNREKIRASYRAWCEKNREYLREWKLNYKRRNRERTNQQASESQKRCWARDPSKRIATSKRWKKKNPGMFKMVGIISAHRRRVAEKAHSFTRLEWEGLRKFYGYSCLCCGKVEPKIVACADHVIPLALGGTNQISNIQPLCKSCNSKKYTKIIDYRPQWLAAHCHLEPIGTGIPAAG
jgi:5-methylcytosine-specific restriction endonuclease McrA